MYRTDLQTLWALKCYSARCIEIMREEKLSVLTIPVSADDADNMRLSPEFESYARNIMHDSKGTVKAISLGNLRTYNEVRFHTEKPGLITRITASRLVCA